jgi:UDP-N-acetylmuramate dehydrogenase
MEQTATVDLAAFTTLRLGGPARRMVEAASAEAIVAAVAAADAANEALLVLGGGSNLVIADAGFDGTVVRLLSRGIDVQARDGSTSADDTDEAARVRLVVAAGEPWDELVAYTVANGLSGVECLSGIPGATGATPIQNVGAYGASVADVLTRVRVWDRDAGQIVDLTPEECAFGYRTSIFKHDDRRVVLEVELELERTGLSAPIRYAELARRLDVAIGERAPLEQVRETVLQLRRGKGMVLDPHEPDSVSAGSFFTNPILSAEAFAAFERLVAQELGSDVRAPSWPDADGRVKTSAAWLIERAGFTRGHGSGRVGLSSKHTLAIINRGGATTDELVAFARSIRDGVHARFAIELHPEPTFVGVSLRDPAVQQTADDGSGSRTIST